MATVTPRVTVVIPAYNEAADIVPGLDRLLEATGAAGSIEHAHQLGCLHMCGDTQVLA